jgi:hypothetical protein
MALHHAGKGNARYVPLEAPIKWLKTNYMNYWRSKGEEGSGGEPLKDGNDARRSHARQSGGQVTSPTDLSSDKLYAGFRGIGSRPRRSAQS